jgi:hypothetical protein
MKFLLAAVLLLVALPARAQVDPNAHTMTSRELWEWAAKKADVVLLGRVLAPVSDPRPDTNYAAKLGVQCVTARIEPIDWLKGKLDGDEIEVLHNWAVDRNDQRLRAIAGRDTMAAVLSSSGATRAGTSSSSSRRSRRGPAEQQPEARMGALGGVRAGVAGKVQVLWTSSTAGRGPTCEGSLNPLLAGRAPERRTPRLHEAPDLFAAARARLALAVVDQQRGRVRPRSIVEVAEVRERRPAALDGLVDHRVDLAREPLSLILRQCVHEPARRDARAEQRDAYPCAV